MNCAKCAMQARNGARENRKARAREPAGTRGVEAAQALRDGHVVGGLEVESPRLAVTSHFHIGRGVPACRHAVVQEVRQIEEQAVEVTLQ
jgi:hypothetical protein